MSALGRTARAKLNGWQARFAAASWPDRIGFLVAAAAVSIAFGVAVCGINGPVPEGHYASSAGIGVAGLNMWEWRTLFPIVAFLDRPPVPANYYMHHPMGIFWMIALLGKVFGFTNWVLRLPPLFYVTLTALLLYQIGRGIWGRLPGGLAALAFVALPITLGYANYHDLEQPVMFGCVLSTWGYLRFVETSRERYALASVLGFLFALNHDWPAYMWGGIFLAGLFVYAYLIPERTRRSIADRSFGRYWALMVVAAALSLALELALLYRSASFADLLSSYVNRASGSGLPLSLVLKSRQYRIELMFTGLAILLGKLAVPVILGRAIVKRDHRELLPYPLLLTAVIQYLIFKQGADVHIFWPHYFATYFGLAVGALAATVADAARFAAGRIPRSGASHFFRRAAPWLALGMVGVPVLFVLKDGLSIVRLARESGGRFAEANLESGLEGEAVLRWFVGRFPRAAGVAYHPSAPPSYPLQWAARPRMVTRRHPVAGPVTDQTRIYILDTRATSLADIRLAASRYHVHAVGHVWVMDRAEPHAPITGYLLAEREPAWWERWWYGGVEPMRAVRENSWVTWEWRTLLGQPAEPPAGAPAELEELRIAHNVALARGDHASADRHRADLAARFNLPLKARFEGGATLAGGINGRGAYRTVTLFFVSGAFPADSRFAIHTTVVAPPRLSTLPADPAKLEIPGAPRWPTTLWKPGHLYSIRFPYHERPGTELFVGTWAPGPRRADGPDPIQILRI